MFLMIFNVFNWITVDRHGVDGLAAARQLRTLNLLEKKKTLEQLKTLIIINIINNDFNVFNNF